jgi:hypothetical protein
MQQFSNRNFGITAGWTLGQKTATTTGSEIDITFANKVVVAINVTAIGAADASNLLTFSCTQATATGGTFSAAASAQLVNKRLAAGTAWDLLINATTETGWHYFDFIPAAGYDFFKVVATETGTADVTCEVLCMVEKMNLPATT